MWFKSRTPTFYLHSSEILGCSFRKNIHRLILELCICWWASWVAHRPRLTIRQCMLCFCITRGGSCTFILFYTFGGLSISVIKYFFLPYLSLFAQNTAKIELWPWQRQALRDVITASVILGSSHAVEGQQHNMLFCWKKAK